MTNNRNNLPKTLLNHFVFNKRFQFRTPVPIQLASERVSEIPFTDGNANYTTETEPVGSDYTFDIWEGNKYQRERSKARIVGQGWLTKQGNQTIVQGEVKVSINRMLVLSIITLVMAIWMFSLFIMPFGFIYLLYTGGLPIVAPVYLMWQTLKKRDAMVNEIQTAITPHLSDRQMRLRDQHQNSSFDTYSHQEKKLRNQQR